MKRVRGEVVALAVLMGCGGLASSTGGSVDSGGAPHEAAARDTSSADAGSCEPGKVESRSLMTVLASGQTGPIAVVTDDTSIYWVNQGLAGPGSIVRVPKSGGATSTLVSTGLPRDLAVDSVSVYWTDVGGASGAVLKQPKDGGAWTTLASMQSDPGSIALDATHVYWSNIDGNLMSVPLGGGTPTTLASSGGSAIALDSSRFFWVAGADCGGGVMTVPLAGGAATTLASNQSDNSHGIAANDEAIYWTQNCSTAPRGAVMKLPLAGGPAVTLAAGGSPVSVAIDDSSVYWTDERGDCPDVILKVAMGGGPLVTLAAGVTAALAVDASSVYAFVEDGGRGAHRDAFSLVRISPK